MSSSSRLVFLSVLYAGPALADDAPPPVTFTPIAEVRPREEVRATLDGSSEPLLGVNQRTRLGGTVSAGPKIAVDVVFQDVRVWGEEADTLKDYAGGGIDLHVGQVRWQPVDAVGFTVGRQQIAFHEERIVGAVDWAPQGRHFDAGRVTVQKGAVSVDAVGAVVLEKDTLLYAENAGAFMLRGGWSPRPAVVVDALYVWDMDGNVERSRHTVGAYVKGGNKLLSGRVEGYFQGGEVGRATIGAHLIGVSGTISPESSLQPKVTLWFDRLSGDADLGDGTATTFEPVYQTGHKFYGRMDLFYATPADPTGHGLHDGALKLQMTPVKNGQINLDAHAFLAAAGDDGLLGEEVDLWWTQTIGPRFRIVLGAAGFNPADSAADPAVFSWLELGAKY